VATGRSSRRKRCCVTSSLLPDWSSVLAVVAHPDDESFGLGAVLSAFAGRGATVSVLCFTHGEASTLHGVDGNLATIRAEELAAAARELGITNVHLMSYPDGGLAGVDAITLGRDIEDAADLVGAAGIVVFDPDGVTGHPDHQRTTQVAIDVAARRGIGVLGWTIPSAVATALNEEFGASFTGHDSQDIDLVIDVDRMTQNRAVACHPSQAVPGSVLWRRLELLRNHEHLRWLPTAVGELTTSTMPGRSPGHDNEGDTP